MSKSFWGVIVGIILVFVGVVALTGNKTAAPGSKSGTLTQHVEGNGKSGVTLVEYGDYQCPYCQQYYPIVKQVEAEFNDQIKLQFRNFPLVSLHHNAFAAARAAEAAALQNKFWEMHDVLYENNDPNGASGWVAATDPNTYFDQFATQIGLNLTKFKADFSSSQVNDLINADEAEGNKLGVTGTPTFFLNGKQIQVGNDLASFEKVIKAAIDKQGATNAGTTSQTSAPAKSGQ